MGLCWDRKREEPCTKGSGEVRRSHVSSEQEKDNVHPDRCSHGRDKRCERDKKCDREECSATRCNAGAKPCVAKAWFAAPSWLRLNHWFAAPGSASITGSQLLAPPQSLNHAGSASITSHCNADILGPLPLWPATLV
eukprot:363301-Chlamydomonas_euryale.AAC.9